MRKKGTKYDKIEILPKKARTVSTYAEEEGIGNPSYVCVKYDRFVAGKGGYPGYDIRCFQGMNFVIPS